MIHATAPRRLLRHEDEQIAEIYALARESFFGGQEGLPDSGLSVPDDAAQYGQASRLPAHGLLENDQEGNDHFEVTHTEPKVDVVRQALRRSDAAAPPRPAERAEVQPRRQSARPRVPQEIATPVAEKNSSAKRPQVAQLISRGTPTCRCAPHRWRHDPISWRSAGPCGTESRIDRGRCPARSRPISGPRGSHNRRDHDRQHHEPASTESRAGGGAPLLTQGSAGSGGGLFSGLFSSNGDGAKSGGDSGGMLDRMSRLVGLQSSDAADTAAKTKSTAKSQTAAAGAPGPSLRRLLKVNLQPRLNRDVKSANAAPPNHRNRRRRRNSRPPPPGRSSQQHEPAAGRPGHGSAGSFDSRWGAMR